MHELERDNEPTPESVDRGPGSPVTSLAMGVSEHERLDLDTFEAYVAAGRPFVDFGGVDLGGRPPVSPGAATISVVLSTYNQPRLLDRTLLGYARQSHRDFELIVADDGSGAETRRCIEAHQLDFPVPLVHVWQPDDGFHKSRAVNRGVLAARSDYLLFSDGDCIPSRDFIAQHAHAASAGHYVVGGFVRLSEAATEQLAREDVTSGEFERLVRLADRLELGLVHAKSLFYIAIGKRRKPKFYGLNFSVSRKDFERVNGFDDTYHNSGKEDSDLRNRMQMAGIRAISLWNRPGVFHQHHPGHSTRHGWRGVVGYYNRGSIRPEAPCGLRELQEQDRTSTKAL